MGQWATPIPPKDTADRIADAWGAGCKIDRSIRDGARVAMSKLVRLSLRATAEEREVEGKYIRWCQLSGEDLIIHLPTGRTEEGRFRFAQHLHRKPTPCWHMQGLRAS